jgi:glycosyltransferase involved in cell wall biosynthesis
VRTGEILSIRLAYDILFLANFFDQPGGQSGVYRTVESLFSELCKRDEVAVTAMAVTGADALVDVTNACRFLETQKERLQFEFDPVIKGRFGLSQRYLQAFGTGEIADHHEKARSLLTRVVRKLEQRDLRIASHRYDVFHSPFFPLPAREVLGNLPRVQTVFDLICQRNPEWMPPEVVKLSERILNGIDKNNDWVTCISDFTKHEFCEFTGMSPERVFVTPLAAAEHFRRVDDAAKISAARGKYGIPEGDYFLTLGALQPRKNFQHIIRSFLRLLNEQPKVETNLVITGATAWKYDEILGEIETSSAYRDRIIFTGFIPDDDLGAIYSGATAFVFPSLYEGFGLPPLEAMQCGTPVIASNTTAMPEVVGDAGLLIDPTDADALCEAMLKVLTDQELRLQLSRKGLQRAQQFSWARCADETIAVYQTAVANR